jgi:uncharacterized damage-inducible protein DinB
MTPGQGDFLRYFTLVALRNEHPVTLRVIRAIPDDKALFRPHENGRSAIDLAWHIVFAEHRFLSAVVNGEFDFTGTKPEEVQTVADVARWYVASFQRDIEGLKALSSEALVKIVDFRGLHQLPAVTFMQVGLSHSIHHRGQLSMYLRPMGAKVPSIYGESYDSREARQAAPLH